MMQGRTEAHTVADSDASNVLIKYLVPPPVQKEFIEVFQSVKEGRYCSSVLSSWAFVLANACLTRTCQSDKVKRWVMFTLTFNFGSFVYCVTMTEWQPAKH